MVISFASFMVKATLIDNQWQFNDLMTTNDSPLLINCLMFINFQEI